MPQPFNWKDSDVRITESVQAIHNAGATPTYVTVVNYLTVWSGNHLNAARKATISQGMHQGFHWEKGRSQDSKDARKGIRDQRRAMILMRVVILNEPLATAQIAVSAVADNNVRWQLGLLVGDCARALMPVPDVNTASGRLQRRGLLSPNNRTFPFFADQDTLLAHFRDHVMPTIGNATTRDVYRVALQTIGNPIWRPGNSDPASKARFDQFGTNDDAQRLEFNCWEALLFWACKGGAFTVAGCRALYDDFELADRSANLNRLFGTAAAFNQATALPGDILTWVNGGTLNHVAMYAGLGPAPALTPYILHHLSLDEDQDHVGGGEGTVHFRTAARMLINYNNIYGAATCYQTQPFWVAAGNTAQYQYAEGLK
ncbi:MAG: hypothetical protein NTV70_02580 [Acidobacteria bacterium]|nr:hypothetical protein [Acidobacteriota bacterium]